MPALIAIGFGLLIVGIFVLARLAEIDGTLQGIRALAPTTEPPK